MSKKDNWSALGGNGKQLINSNVSKYNVGGVEKIDLPINCLLILVVGQVETDASIAKGSSKIKTNLALLSEVRKINPEAYIVYKPHPDVVAGGRYGEMDEHTMKTLCDIVITNVSITELFKHIDEIHTMCSLTGFEALLRGIKVVTYGMPFYAGWGLTKDYLSCHRRTRKLTLEQLIAVTLIEYPIYVDPESKEFINVETAIELLKRKKQFINKITIKTKIYRLFRNYFLKR